MIIVRPIARKDQNIFEELSLDSLLGMTNLPKNQQKLLKKITLSEASFLQRVTQPGAEEYYFVLEDLQTSQLGGTCGILAHSTQSFTHCYRIETLQTQSKNPSVPKEIKTLKIVENTLQASEICALYLHPAFRHSGQGRLLSLSRFLFIAAHRQRFKKQILAEMRGYINASQVSPFWQAVGRHFCDLSFIELMANIDQMHTFINEIIPQFPIYVDLLPKEVQEVIGKTHDSTLPAYQMLVQENFSFNQEIDIFEGGPILSAKTPHIRTIKKSVLGQVELTTDSLIEEPSYLLSNERLDFRACIGKLKKISSTQILITEEVANALLVKKRDQVRYVTIH